MLTLTDAATASLGPQSSSFDTKTDFVCYYVATILAARGRINSALVCLVRAYISQKRNVVET